VYFAAMEPCTRAIITTTTTAEAAAPDLAIVRK
jgi:hypothetical protein